MGKYKTKEIEPRGQQPKEPRMAKTFWKKHKMEDVITWSAAELEEKLTAFFDEYEQRNIKAQGYTWWYPDDPHNRVVDLRYKK